MERLIFRKRESFIIKINTLGTVALQTSQAIKFPYRQSDSFHNLQTT